MRYRIRKEGNPAMKSTAPAILLIALVSTCSGQGGQVPPGQTVVTGDNFPVFSYSGDRHLSTMGWELEIYGLVENDTTLTWEEFSSLPTETLVEDFHCVTGWSRIADEWTGVPTGVIADIAVPTEDAVAVMIHCADGYTTNLLLEDFLADGVMLATGFDGEPLTQSRGFPVRLLVPHLYAWKSAKWVTGIEFMDENMEGYWELRGYHLRGDPWEEQRYSR
jgi:DMSO/TMAO reductase YedYZ molybdopterin-dependent catalytic subunit